MRTIEISPGSHLRDALAHAVDVAAGSDGAVYFAFNGVRYDVQPGESYDDAKARAEEVLGHPILDADQEAEEARRRTEGMEAAWAKAIAEAGAMTEEQMRDAEVPRIRSMDELTSYIDSLVERPHDYGTCVYAMSMAATAAFNYAAGKLGVTGFQAGCADMDILRRTRNFKWGKLLNYENLLYPQYCDAEHFPTAEQLIREHSAELGKRAEKLLVESTLAHPEVKAHWERLARGEHAVEANNAR